MKYQRLRIILLAALLFLIITLSVANIAGFNGSFYKSEFKRLGVYSRIDKADDIHEEVMNYLNGANKFLPDVFNEREKSHFADVKSLVTNSRMILFFSAILFSAIFAFFLNKEKNQKLKNVFVGNISYFGGLITLIFFAIILILLNLNFDFIFSNFHEILFKAGTFSFDPSENIIVRLYPEELFQDLGIRIFRWICSLSVMFIIMGRSLTLPNHKE